MIVGDPRVGMIGGGAYQANAVVFDGTNDYLLRGADLTSNADSKVGILSFWVKKNADGATVTFFQGGGIGVRVRISAANTVDIRCFDASATDDVKLFSTNAYTTASGWVHILASWNCATTTGHLWINDAQDEATNTIIDDTLNYTGADYSVGAETDGNRKVSADISEFYFNNEEYLDISIEANRRLFIDDDSKPVDLGEDGSDPTGTSPRIYLNGDATSFQTNQGTGGNFTVTGTLTDASTSPSD